ncbi:MAG TPA: hypothetical protein VHD85_21750 [Terracidiphilus sp.]|nr:hypothetical protein [Terracidiphilus sp.]
MSNEQPPEGLPPGFVNTWKPITDAYQQVEAPSIDQVLQPPPVEGKPAVPVRQRITPKLPLAIAILGWFYMARAVIYLVFALILFSQPDSGFAGTLIQYSGFLVPFRMHRTQGLIPVGLFAEALAATAILSVVVGGMWLARYWRIRWITMFYAGASAARTLIYVVTGAAGGLTGVITPEQKQAMLAGCAVNILIFCYLAFYPGVEQAFEDKL